MIAKRSLPMFPCVDQLTSRQIDQLTRLLPAAACLLRFALGAMRFALWLLHLGLPFGKR
jgi:hypothetical protein